MPKQQSNPSRRWIFTINNPQATPTEVQEALKEKVNYLVFQKEKGNNEGTVHYQGFLILKKPERMAAMKKIFPTAHLEVPNGTDDQNEAYCTKEDTRIEGPFFLGKRTSQGKRSDLEDVVEKIATGATIFQLAEECPKQVIKYSRGIEQLLRLKNYNKFKNSFRTVEVVVHWGKTGTGKTHSVYESEKPENIYRQSIRTGRQIWFDNYNYESVLLIDEFTPGDIALGELNQLLDKYPYQVSTKGSGTMAGWTKVYITSNFDPRGWYRNANEEHRLALLRRLTRIIRFDDIERRNEENKGVVLEELLPPEEKINFTK